MKITSGGQISIPAEIRKRWQASNVTIDDEGDHIVVHPAPEDPIDAAVGMFAEYFKDGPTVDEMRQQYKQEEREIEERKWARFYGKENDPT